MVKKLPVTVLCLLLLLPLTQIASAQTRNTVRGGIRERIEARRRERASASDDNTAVQIRVGDLTRTYLLHVPPSYDKTKPTAVVLVFHGGSGSAARASKVGGGMNAFADSHGFIAVYPEGVDKHWNDGRETQPKNTDDVGFVSALIDDLARSHNIDRNRVYATGISNGGMFSLRLACDLSGKIAAVAAVAATMPQNLVARCTPRRAVSVLIMHGTADPLIPYAGGEIAGGGTRRGYGGRALSAADSVRFWVTHDRAADSPVVTRLPDTVPEDGTRVIRQTHGRGRDDTEVLLYEIEGGGHTWPGGDQHFGERLVGKVSRDINGNQIIWDFFAAHPLK